MEMYYGETLRDTILGKRVWKQCLVCNSTGFVNWDEDGNDVKSGKDYTNNRCTDECDNCNGLGFV